MNTMVQLSAPYMDHECNNAHCPASQTDGQMTV